MTYPTLRLSRLASVTLGKMLQSSASSERDVEADYLRAAHVQPFGRLLDLDDLQRMWFSPAELSNLRLERDDVVVVEGGAGFGRSAHISNDLAGWGFQNSIIRCRPRPGVASGRFLDYALQSALLTGATALVCSTATIPHFTAEKVAAFLVPAPPLPEQRAIADFLDRETAKIDALIEKQNELIDLLRERRGALILRGVIGADAVLRKSATLGWTSDVPVRWSVQPVSYVADVTLGKMVTSSQPSPQSDLRPYLRAANVQPDGQTAFDDLNEMWFTPTEAAELTIRRGDVVVVEGGQGGFGRAAWVREDLPGVGFQNSINRLRPRASDGRYLAYSLIAVRATGFMHAYCDTVSMPHLTSEKLSRIRLAIPPLHAQREIADHLDRETAKIDALIAKAQEFVELARERRAALITAAVTGQIDVTQKAA